MANTGLFDWTSVGLLRNLSSSVTTTFWSYFTASSEVTKTEGKHDDEYFKELDGIQDALTELYGNVAGIVLKQALSILKEQYDGNMDTFLTEFFWPAIELLSKLKQAEQSHVQGLLKEKERKSDSECDTIVTEDSDNQSYYSLCHSSQSECKNSNHSDQSECKDSSQGDISTGEDISIKSEEVGATLDDTEEYTLCVEQTVATSENKELNDDSLSDCDTSSASNNSNSEGKEFACDNFWPLVHNSSVIVNFIECARDKFFNGDLNLFVKLDESNNIVLCVKYLIGNTANEIDLSESQFGKIFTMEWKDELVSDSTDELGEVLKSCLASLEDSTEKLRWQEVVLQSVAYRRGTGSSSGNHGDKSKKSSVQCSRSHGVSHDNGKSVKNDRNNCLKCDYSSNQGSYLSYNDNHKCSDKTTPHSLGYHKSLEFNKVLTDSPDLRSKTMEGTDGREIDKPRSPRTGGLHQHRHLEPPKTILDVDYKLLQSGVAILPGCRDLDGNAVVLIFTSSTLWKNQLINSTDLARLIMFYYSVPRETVRCRGLTIIADIRGCTTSTINTLLESLYLFEGNLPQAISVVHLLTDKHTQSLVLKSPIYDVHAAFQIDLLLSSNLLCSYISPDQLPPVLEGTFQYNHDDWIRFHMRLDPFLANCRSVARYLANVIQELSVVDQVPVSAKEASHLVDHHENIIKSTFEDPRVQRLQNEGDSLLLSLQKEEINIGHTDDYRYAMEDITRLYRHVQETISRLMHISDTRITRLEKCYQLKDFDEECTKVISWLHTQGNECLQRHLVMADNLKAVRMQQKDFEKFYYAAMSHIEKGNDLLEEASTLAQSGDFDEVTGYKELARMLKRHLHEFSERLEETRERIEGTSKCYQLLDKTYEWALEAMKYVASMKMEHCATPEGLEKLLHSLELYLQEHPPISDDTFISMSDIAKKLGNDKLLEQCLTAQNRCQETQKMLTCRGNTLQQFREQLEQEASAARSTKSSSALNSNQRNYSDLCRYSSYSTVSNTNDINSVSSTGLGTSAKSNWEPKDMSTPVVPKTYSRTLMERLKKSTSFSSSSSSPASSPSHSTASTNSPSHVSRSPCVSSDISPVHSISSSQMFYQTPVPVLPVHNNDKLGELEKSLTDSSKENILDSTNSRGFLTPNNSDLKVTSPNKAKNILRRAISTPQTTGLSSPIVEEDQGSESHNNRVLSLRQNGRTDSMITGSSDSLPSLPEEDEGVVTIATEEQDYIRKEWTPVPVNTHLTDTSCNTTPLRPLSDLKLSEEEIKSRRTLSLIMSEMVQTERDYVCSLRFIVEHYIPEMEREDVPQALRGKRNVIFGNIEKIFQFHQQYFLQEMEASKRNPFLIARYFLMHENQFHLYALYNKNKPKSDALMAEYGKLFFRDKQLELGDKMDLSSYLLKPVQRMGKYALLIKQVLKECSRTAPEYQDLKAAEEMVRFQLRHGNDLLAMDALRDCDVNLQEQGRLLRQEEFLVYHGRRKFMRHVFLFEDLILFSKTKRSRSGFQDTYLYKFSFKMSDIGLTQDYEGSGYKFEIWWRRRNTGESYVLQAPSSEHKKSWVKEMTKILWNQAIKNRENRLSELATMGIGNKPCLDIKPSSDNINDRFINIAVGSRDARSRNSIAVCSNDLLRQGNKRPHSIISVSSNSSSNSSQSGFGAMNLATSHTDSPRTYRRSLTFMSSESGIGTSIASGADIDSTKIDLADFSRAQSPPPYADFQRPHSAHILDREFGKPRIMNLPSHAEEMTDV
ncbi:Pleckstrin y domain containing [Mactra antiquata]